MIMTIKYILCYYQEAKEQSKESNDPVSEPEQNINADVPFPNKEYEEGTNEEHEEVLPAKEM